MFSRTLGAVLLAAGCVTAGAAGAYVATRQGNEAKVQLPAEQGAPSVPASPSVQPVAETEAVVRPAESRPAESRPAPQVDPAPIEAAAPVVKKEPPQVRPASSPRRVATPPKAGPARRVQDQRADVRSANSRTEETKPPAADPVREVASPVSSSESLPRPEPAAPAKPAEPQFEEVILPSSSVIGLEVETSVTSERAQVEDRVDARVTRDVYVDGRLVIPSRSRMIGNVTLVERGGKVKERARLGVRFHTLVLGDGRQVAVRTETILREGEPPSGESSRKIGGAAIGGAVLGAIIGGGKGAVLGGAAGAAGGTAAVMAGGRNAATLAGGTVVTARLSGPVAIEVEKR